MKASKKVYCKNCKFEGFLLCNLMSKSSIQNKYTNRCEGFKILTENTDGDCKHYKRKWYKFWINYRGTIITNEGVGMKASIEISKKIRQELCNRLEYGGSILYGLKHKVGIYQLVDSWHKKPSCSFNGYLFLIIKDVKTNKYYQNKVAWCLRSSGYRGVEDYSHYYDFKNNKCVEVENRKTPKEWKVKVKP